MATILCVDDEATSIRLLEDALQRAGHLTVGVYNVDAALNVLSRGGIDLVISDYKMPGTNGLMLATRIRQLYPQTVIIMITAYVYDVLSSQIDCACIQRILEKPT